MKVLLFGGTTEGRLLAAALSDAGIEVTLSVATEFGKAAVRFVPASIIADRLGKDAIVDMLKQNSFDHVIDATHPYAVLASLSIQAACRAAGTGYIRLKRPESPRNPGVTYVPGFAEAAEALNKSGKKALLTVGSKYLEPFTHVRDFNTRLYVRMLPMLDSLKKALNLGYSGSNIICMQGPFDREMNTATIKKTGAQILVTKDSGDLGGFEEKVSAALLLGCDVIVISRPVQEAGLTFEEILEAFGAECQTQAPDSGKPGGCGELDHTRSSGELLTSQKKTAFFPLFVDLRGRKALVVGAGGIAERRIRILLEFGAEITVISPMATEYITTGASKGSLNLTERKYQSGDVACLCPVLVVAATDDRQVNREVMLEAESLGIPVSVADCREECSFYFPAIAESETQIAGLVSKDGDHEGVKEMAVRIRGLLNL